eukprot:5195103-Pyramimonas_sp.AAC.1
MASIMLPCSRFSSGVPRSARGVLGTVLADLKHHFVFLEHLRALRTFRGSATVSGLNKEHLLFKRGSVVP